jgi:hypothetical protein
VEGYRIAFSTNVGCSDSQTPISDEHSRPAAFILDFNPASVRWARQEEKAGRGLRGALVTEPSVLPPGSLLAEEVVRSLPYTRTMLEGYLPRHQIRLSRDEVVYPVSSTLYASFFTGLWYFFLRQIRCKDPRCIMFTALHKTMLEWLACDATIMIPY